MSRVNGLKELVAQFKKIGYDVEAMVKGEIEGAGRDIEAKAKQLAPVDLGKLRQSINYSSTNNGYGASISANAPYAIYQEVGTGGLVNVPAELKPLAEYYKGKGVRQINIRPQPFLYPATVEGRKKLIENISKGLVRIVK